MYAPPIQMIRGDTLNWWRRTLHSLLLKVLQIIKSFLTYIWKYAFSESPSNAAEIAITNPRTPKNTWAGIIVSLTGPLSVGKRNAINPTTYCIEKIMTADKPIQEWSEYIFGMGLAGKLCESKTAINAITVKKNARPWITACEILRGFFRFWRNPR